MRRPLRAEPVGIRAEVSLEDRFEDSFSAPCTTRSRMQGKLSLFLGDVHPAVRMGFVPACFEVVPYSRKETIQSDGFDGLKCLTVDPSRTTVPLGYTVGLFEGLLPCHINEDAPEAMCLFRLRLPIYPPSQPATRWVPLSSHPLPRLCKRNSSSVRALPSGRVLLHAHQRYLMTRSNSLTPTLPFPTHGYRQCLFGGISPAGRRGSLQLTRCRSHHVAADTPRVRTAVSDCFRRPLLPSRVIDRLGHRLIHHPKAAKNSRSIELLVDPKLLPELL